MSGDQITKTLDSLIDDHAEASSLANCLTLRGPRPRRTRARLAPCRATAGLPRASSCKPATVRPPRASRCRPPCACRRWALCASHHGATVCEPSPSTPGVPREPSPGCRVRAAASRLCDRRAFLLADSREADMVFGFWSRSKEERGCLPALRTSGPEIGRAHV